MEQEVIFRDYQEMQTEDLNNIQVFTRQSFDDLVNDAVTASLRYSGFSTTQSNTAEVTVAPGRFYGANQNGEVGAIFILTTNTVISLVQYLAVSTQRILTLVVYGSEDQINTETRDFLTNTQTLQTSPQAVAMTDSRDAILAIVAGAEGPAPSPPAIATNQVAIANILMSTTGVVSVTMLPAAMVTSTEDLNARVATIEAFDAAINPQLASLSSSIAALQLALSELADNGIVVQLAQDVAQIKSTLGLPTNYADYGASFFLWPDPTVSDTGNTQSLGYNATVSYGIRFPNNNESTFALSLFNPLDPNAGYDVSTGLLLPAYTTVMLLQTATEATSSIAIGQYSYQTFNQEELNIPYTRIRYGGEYIGCTNGVAYQETASTGTPAWWLPNFSEYTVTSETQTVVQPPHTITYTNDLIVDNWTEPYWTLEDQTNSVNGALIAQSFLVGSDQWITQIGIDLQTIASPSANINITLCQCTNGQPDLTQVLVQGVMSSADLIVGVNYLQVNPTFLQKGMRCAVVVISNANHGLGLAPTGSYLDGTFFYSLDGVYFLGDFTKEMYLEIWGCEFNSSQITIQLGALNLGGGIRAIDLTARLQIPDSCELTFEVQIAGSSAWLPIATSVPGSPPFPTAPPLCNFQARFIGSPDIMPGVVLTDSICTLSNPATVFNWVSTKITVGAATATVNIKFRIAGWNATAHSLSAGTGLGTGYVKLYYAAAAHLPTTMTITLVTAATDEYDVLCTWTGISPEITQFTFIINGTTNSNTSVFIVENMTWWCL